MLAKVCRTESLRPWKNGKLRQKNILRFIKRFEVLEIMCDQKKKINHTSYFALNKSTTKTLIRRQWLVFASRCEPLTYSIFCSLRIMFWQRHRLLVERHLESVY